MTQRPISRASKQARTIVIAMVRLYQLMLSPLLGGHCKFAPTCSTYFIQSVEMHGVVRGMLKGLTRILRCNPWSKGGYDPVR